MLAPFVDDCCLRWRVPDDADCRGRVWLGRFVHGPPPNTSHTCWVIVPPGLRRAVPSVTNRPVDAERDTAWLLLVPEPTRSVVVVRGDRVAAALVTKRPVRALRLTDLAMVSSWEPWTRGRVTLLGSWNSARIARTTNHGTCDSHLELLGGSGPTDPPFCVIGLADISILLAICHQCKHEAIQRVWVYDG